MLRVSRYPSFVDGFSHVHYPSEMNEGEAATPHAQLRNSLRSEVDVVDVKLRYCSQITTQSSKLMSKQSTCFRGRSQQVVVPFVGLIRL
jgi:hypothetical protein